MNPWQMARQAQFALRERDWEDDSANENVFSADSVRITPMPVEDLLAVGTPTSPMCKINLGRQTSDVQAKGFVAQELLVTLAVAVEGDEMYENAMIGANRSAGTASSKGRGLAEVEAEMMATLQDVTAMAGFQVQGYSVSGIEVVPVSSTVAWVWREYTFLFYCTSQLSWLGPTSLTATGHTGGTAGLAWTPAPTSWSSIAASGGQIIRYAAGSTPPATVSDGIAGPAVTGTDSSATISGLSSGAYAVSVFTAYKESGASSGADRWSPPTSILVTVP